MSRGPTAAPRVSMLRWKPKALPMYLRWVESAIMASRGLPAHALAHPVEEDQQQRERPCVTSASRGFTALETL